MVEVHLKHVSRQFGGKQVGDLGKWIVVCRWQTVGHLRWKLFFFAIVSCHLLSLRDGDGSV